jgi:very-short-patch-repair endonuclease
MRRIERARALRRRQTDAGDLPWTRLRRHNLGYQFRKQVPMDRYFVDFVCLKARLVVEVGYAGTASR